MCATKPNIWLDLSAVSGWSRDYTDEHLKADLTINKLPAVAPSFLIDDLKEAIVYLNKYDRLLFGSDWPLRDPVVHRMLIEQIIPKDHHIKVFRENAEKLFHINIPDRYESLNLRKPRIRYERQG